MSKTPAPQTPPDDELGFFDGLPVVSTAVKVTNAGDGLSTAMKIARRQRNAPREIRPKRKRAPRRRLYGLIDQESATLALRAISICRLTLAASSNNLYQLGQM